MVTGTILVFWKHHGFGAYVLYIRSSNSWKNEGAVQGRLPCRWNGMKSCGIAIGHSDWRRTRALSCGDYRITTALHCIACRNGYRSSVTRGCGRAACGFKIRRGWIVRGSMAPDVGKSGADLQFYLRLRRIQNFIYGLVKTMDNSVIIVKFLQRN